MAYLYSAFPSFVFHFLQSDKSTHHFFKPFELVDSRFDPVYINHVHYSEWKIYLIFANVIMYNHEFCNFMKWYECMSIFNSCLCKATWICAHLLDVFVIWFVKPDKEPLDLEKTAFRDEEDFQVPLCEQHLEATDGK